MTEEMLFAAALEKTTPDGRSAFLDDACSGDAALRKRVEALLQSHGHADFLKAPAVTRPIEELAGQACAGDTQTELPAGDGDVEALDFLVPSDEPGACGQLGHYDVLEVIGRGGMGIVLRAFDAQLQRVVAIKVMAAQLATNATARKRFTREARAAAAVSHDHIVTIHAVEEGAAHPYLVMQYVAGMSLQERLDRNGPLQLTEILRIGMQTASGLAAAHAQGLVHRDIKPANILLENGVERVKVTDFGLARAAAEAHLTQSGVVAGTPQYMSPEQARGEAVDQRTDLFSLGSVLYAMCTGRAPFRASGSMAVLKRVCEETPTPIRETNPDIPDWLVAVIDKLHAKDPAGRYQTAAEVAELLNQHLAHLQHPSMVPLPVTRLARPPTARRRQLVAVLALLSLIAVVIALTAVLPRFFPPVETPIVNDNPEGKAPSSGTPAKPDPLAFVLLSGKRVAQRKFATLAEAVLGASAGDTIEIRGNGPFVSEPINLAGTALTIRAAEGFRPAFQLRSPDDTASLLATDAALVLEGLEFQGDPQRGVGMLRSSAPLYLANCRLISKSVDKRRLGALVIAVRAPLVELRNCEFLGRDFGAPAVRWNAPPTGRLSMENCCGIDGRALRVSIMNHEPKDISIRLARNTWSTKWSTVTLAQEVPVTVPPATADYRLIRWTTTANVFDAENALLNFEQAESVVKTGASPAVEAEALLARVANWQEEKNAYSVSGFLTLSVGTKPTGGGFKDLAAWNRFWKLTDTGSFEGRARFQGGNLRARTLAAPENVGPDDFRLRPDSPGYKAGKDGKDLGADVDLVGPGPAYERWKKTPEYQQWLKDTAYVKKVEGPTAEPKAFVVLGGKGVAERKFDTLAEAVPVASDGDTIEVRGNGPFVCQPINLARTALTIRAAERFRPVLQLPPRSSDDSPAFLTSDARLVLEGLELRGDHPSAFGMLNSRGPLYLANCRLISKSEGKRSSQLVLAHNAPFVELRNCEFLRHDSSVPAVRWNVPPTGRFSMENCCGIDGRALRVSILNHDPKDISIRLARNTWSTKWSTLMLAQERPVTVPQVTADHRLIHWNTVANVIDTAHFVLAFEQSGEGVVETGDLLPLDAEVSLARMVNWQEEKNVYSASGFLTWGVAFKHTGGLNDLAEWTRFWKLTGTGSFKGSARFQGGNLRARTLAAPENVGPDDFRLRPDSPGYKAGKDGNDLGADVDLVGPGPAYERWKKTPEHQQWLKDSGQPKK